MKLHWSADFHGAISQDREPDESSYWCVGAGMKRAAQDAEEKLGVDTSLIMCFLRHLPAEDAERALDLVSEAVHGFMISGSRSLQ